MYIEQRVYSLVPGGVAEYLRLYEECGRAIQEGHLGQAIGCFTREFGDLNQLVYLWPFDTLDERSRRRAGLLADAGFKEFRGKVRHLLLKQENQLLRHALTPTQRNTAGGTA
jgi:hypothetical protein